jgi:hypothetical protein
MQIRIGLPVHPHAATYVAGDRNAATVADVL